MTDEQINVAIAEACGWRNITDRNSDPDIWISIGEKQIGDDEYVPAVIPNYCADLNAMHEVEKTMDEQQYSQFSDHLYDAEFERQKQTKKWRWLSATARQRAEAFLRTLGKWEEVAK